MTFGGMGPLSHCLSVWLVSHKARRYLAGLGVVTWNDSSKGDWAGERRRWRKQSVLWVSGSRWRPGHLCPGRMAWGSAQLLLGMEGVESEGGRESLPWLPILFFKMMHLGEFPDASCGQTLSPELTCHLPGRPVSSPLLVRSGHMGRQVSEAFQLQSRVLQEVVSCPLLEASGEACCQRTLA